VRLVIAEVRVNHWAAGVLNLILSFETINRGHLRVSAIEFMVLTGDFRELGG
jgi:hypothetical protein